MYSRPWKKTEKRPRICFGVMLKEERFCFCTLVLVLSLRVTLYTEVKKKGNSLL
jgi:hypothetical protein